MKKHLKITSAAANLRTHVLVPLLIVCALCFSKNNYAQTSGSTPPHVLAFGLTDTAVRVATYSQILDNPTLKCLEPNSEVTSFFISFIPSGKDADMYGPFEIHGSTINDKLALKALSKFRDEKSPKTKVFIDQIRTKRNGISSISKPLFFNCTP